MLLARHALDGGALLLPHLGAVEDGVRPPLALLGLVRLEKVQLRRAEGLLAGIVPPGLGRRAALQGYLGRVGVVAVLGRSGVRHVGKACVSPCSSRWAPLY